MRCKHCGAEIIRIHTMGGPAVCWASPTTYWPVRDSEARELLTQNGISVYGNLTGELQDAVGVGYLPSDPPGPRQLEPPRLQRA